MSGSGRTSPLLSRSNSPSFQGLRNQASRAPPLTRTGERRSHDIHEAKDGAEGEGAGEEQSLLGERMVGRPSEGTLEEHRAVSSYPPWHGALSKSPHDRSLASTHFGRELIIETLPSLLFSLCGGILTGELLERVQNWRVFEVVPELFILLPIIMNLKGNLEMNLAARLSTSANIGALDIRATRRSVILGNLTLLQVQALIVSCLASLLSFLLGLLSRNDLHLIWHLPPRPGKAGPGWRPGLSGGYYECVMVLCAGMLAASLSSVVLGSFMSSLIVMSRKWRVNPDNIATPIAGALGDMLTLLVLGLVSAFLIKFIFTIVSTLLLFVLLASAVLHALFTFRNSYVQELLTSGWIPLFVAMTISTCTGLVLENFVNRFEGYGLLASVVTMIAGNTGAIFVSRLSTALHSRKREPKRLVGGVLYCIGVSISAGFLVFVWATGQAQIGVWLACAVMTSCAINVGFSIFLANTICSQLWKRDYDPDIHALPLLTSICDVTGQLLLVSAFSFASTVTGGKEGGPLDEISRNATESFRFR